MFSKNRYIWLVFIFILLVSPGTCTAAASSVTLSLSYQIVSPGDTFTVDVFVEPGVAIAGMQFDLEFDETIFYVDDVTEGDLFTQSGPDTFFNNGSIEPGLLSNVYGVILGPSNVSTPAVFATITMVVDTEDVATSQLNLTNVIISDPTGHAVEVEVTNTTIVIMDICDINGDGVINFLDYEIVDQHFSETTSFPYPSWDVNSDGIVNIMDLAMVGYNLD